jgi:hypothetical protein
MTLFNEAYGNSKPFSDKTAQFGLNASAAVTYTVPGTSHNHYRCEFSYPYNANVWVGYNVTATIPSLGTVASNSSIELRPDVRYVKGGDVLSFISDSSVTDCGLSLLSIPNG